MTETTPDIALPAHEASADADDRLRSLLRELTLEEKVQLLTGRDFWNTWPIERIGLRRILVSDGPSGVRGEVWDERSPSLNLPSATALSSSWDIEIARRYGAHSALEARRKGVDVVLGPTINLHRSPRGGRHFECFSEDPVLTGELAAAYVTGVQENGVGATPKHYIANDFETERFTADVQVDERPLRELYLLAFEKAITESHAWLVMSAYNSINGSTATESELLETPLNSEWGFDGVVISDWTAVRTLESARHAQDLVMPGPDGPWGDALVSAVREGEIAESIVDRKVLRILRLALRVGALDGEGPAVAPTHVEDGPAFARLAAVEGSVLVANDGILPLSAPPARIAVIGHNAHKARTQGGGSATVIPERVVSPLEGVTEAFPSAHVDYAVGAIVQSGISAFDRTETRNPVTGEEGAHVRFLDAEGVEMFAEDRFSGALVYFGGDAPIATATTFEYTTIYTPRVTGEVRIGFSSVGAGRIIVDGVDSGTIELGSVGDDLGAAFLAPPAGSVPVRVESGVPIAVTVEFTPAKLEGGLLNAMSITLGTEATPTPAEELIAEAVDAARAAEVAIVVVGTNSVVESEGYDRESLALPAGQDELVEAVAAANPRTIVVVNSGSPVELPWRDRVSAVLITYFGGQEYGHALADVLTGRSEPGGRLPTTWPAEETDVPVLDVTPQNGVLRYDEGIHIGYRAWLKADREPAYPFGHGLGFTSWSFGRMVVDAEETGAYVVSVDVTNVGQRAGKQIVQVYAERPDSAIDRPVRWLVGFATVRADAGETVTARVTVPRRAFAHWADGWMYEPGTFVLWIGESVASLVGSTPVLVE